ncbi:30S ribosomal protein S1 [uncultured Clostridium sp.]|uniref:30S ribosomal protein S1 n=1 Tax=uncultured Clostridium sp. TaxID=59620 RepID=UPI0026318E68|nr:30S ribosomal protein S1 [uncultured Clostridium sp.]
MNNENISMDDLMNGFELKKFRRGEIVKGKVVSVNSNEIIVNIGHFADGIVSRDEISGDIDFDINSIKAEDDIHVMILNTDDGDGNVSLSKKRADAIKVWEDLALASKEDKVIEIKIKEVVKGGLIAFVNGVRVFMPASQSSAKRLENIEVLVGQNLEVKIIEFNREDKKVVVSRRKIEEAIIKKEEAIIWKTLNVGEKKTGKVTKILKFGAFVNIDGIEGLIHVNELAWTRVKRVEDILTVGDKVEVYIKDIDMDKERLSLSLKDLCENPWIKLSKSKNVGDTVNAKIVRFIQVGAIAEIEGGVEGLVHISEVSDENIKVASDVLKIGQEIKVKILVLDKEREKLSLSIKDATEEATEYMKYNDTEEDFGGLADLFKGLNL